MKLLDEINEAIKGVAVTGFGHTDLESGLGYLGRHLVLMERIAKVMIVGNGGSAAIAAHVVTDLHKQRIAAICFGDAPMLTMLANDYGYAEAYERLIECHGEPGDMVIAISSSGQSNNIARVAQAANRKDLFLVTFSGFSWANPLRRLGKLNFWVPSDSYGVVEMVHHIMLHAMTDALAEQRKEAAA